MKLQNFHKSILGILLTLGVLAALLVPAVPASAAATADWPLQLVGVNSVYITQAQFQTMASANPSAIITRSSTQYKGVALWRLVALVDDSDPSTLNATLATSISIQGYSTPAYNSSAVTSAMWYGTSGSNEENVIVANQIDNRFGVIGPLAGDLFRRRGDRLPDSPGGCPPAAGAV